MDQGAYEADTKTQRAVERNLVGDAAHKLSRALKLANTDIPWDAIYAARSVVVHRYFGVNQKIVWDILQEDLDPLLTKVTELLELDAGL